MTTRTVCRNTNAHGSDVFCSSCVTTSADRSSLFDDGPLVDLIADSWFSAQQDVLAVTGQVRAVAAYCSDVTAYGACDQPLTAAGTCPLPWLHTYQPIPEAIQAFLTANPAF